MTNMRELEERFKGDVYALRKSIVIVGRIWPQGRFADVWRVLLLKTLLWAIQRNVTKNFL